MTNTLKHLQLTEDKIRFKGSVKDFFKRAMVQEDKDKDRLEKRILEHKRKERI